MKMYRNGFLAMALALGAMLAVVTPAKALDYNLGMNPNYNRTAVTPAKKVYAVRYIRRQFTQRQIKRNARAVIQAPVRAVGHTGSFIHNRALDAKRFFMRLGYRPHEAAAIAGHLKTESAMQTKVRGDGGISHGLAQWNGRRLHNLKAFAARRGSDWHEFNTQLAFVDHELRTSEGVAFAALKRSRNVQEATAAFMHFERPRGYTARAPHRGHGWHARLRNAKVLYAAYHSKAAPH